ncbi:MAG TPA: glutathione S-transferase family protein [Gammaproteobacteria bacterium]|nr:glutathione S-transferase family protein [Gammaproteobacteria bacterium]
MTNYKIYGDPQSGNCYKIQLLLGFLHTDYQWASIDILAGETETDDFKAKNPNAKIPVLQIGEMQYLWESNAILHYLAEGSPFLPTDQYAHAQVLQWQFFEQYSHEPYIATARFIQLYLGLPEERQAEYQGKQAGGYKALDVMEQQLAQSRYFIGEQPTIADISLYAYTHVADEGGFDLTPYTQIQRWFADIEALPGYVPMGKSSLTE